MNIKSKFLSLTTRTYPHGHEDDLFHLLPQDLEVDSVGNLYKIIGTNPSTMFTCHLDTATPALTKVKHIIEGDIIKTDGKSILGADDKAGVTIILYMIENKVPGLYYFFMGEEVGCVGSGKLAELHTDNPLDYIKKVVSFDRRGTTSIITHQTSKRCCSDDFGNSLADALNNAGLEVTDNERKLNYTIDSSGVYTDSAKFVSIYPECTNISVGYNSEHTFSERQDIKHLDKLAKAVCLVDWESLPVKRNPKDVEYLSYDSMGMWDGDSHYPTYYSRSYKERNVSYNENQWFVDDKHSNYCSYVTINKWTKKVVDVDIAYGRIEAECELLSELMECLSVNYDELEWDGFKLILTYNEGHKTECDRNDLIDFIPELDFWKELTEDYKREGVY